MTPEIAVLLVLSFGALCVAFDRSVARRGIAPDEPIPVARPTRSWRKRQKALRGDRVLILRGARR